MDKKQDNALLFDFLKVLPEETLLICVNKLIDAQNRVERRNFQKHKELDEKLKFILNVTNYRVCLFEFIYEDFKVNIEIDDTLSFDEILKNMNGINCIAMCVYILYKCCNTAYDKKYFSKFLESEQFQKTIKKEWENTKNEQIVHKDNLIDQSDCIKEENNMKCYLGLIEYRGTYYNFKPQYLYSDNKAVLLSRTTLNNIFPEFGSINLAYKMYAKSEDFLRSLNVNRDNDDKCDSLYAVFFNDDEIEENNNEKIKSKLDLQKLYENDIQLSDRIVPLCNFGMYKIVTPVNKIIGNEAFTSIIPINENFGVDEKVLLQDNDLLYGPFAIQERVDGLKYIRPDSGSKKYILDCVDVNYDNIITFEKEIYLHETIYTDVAIITENDMQQIDVITDSVLLGKIQEKIDIQLLKTNLTEFEYLYSTSPFLSGIHNDIRTKRLERIKEIILNAQEYEDEKKAAILTLIENTEDAENLLGEKIKNSKTYSDLNDYAGKLKEECNKYANLNVALETENLCLIKELEEIKQKQANEVSDLQNKNNEELIQKNEMLSEENVILKEKLSLVEDNINLEEKNKELEEIKQTLLHTYEVLTIQVNEKNKELKTIQDNVKNAIQKGVDEASIAKNAFDPHLANAMMDAAEQWRSDSESRQYKEIVEDLSNLKIEKIEKEVLIDNLVKHVQQFRNYKKNDIINIYICMAQNFLTIFSGEPGTGKTSICNIIANSLGLNNFGTDKNSEVSKNRYVPVSVERGWSSKRDLIGYYNPLTRKYDRSNAKIYDSLMIMDREREDSRFPYLILLDEANLSQMEYYWADFMRVADKNVHNMFINIGLDNDIYIPETLHFLATINNDQTTEELSPRLVDRAWIIKLPNVEVKEISEAVEDCCMDIVLWEDIKNAFVTTNNTEMHLKPVIDQIYKLFENNHLTVSPRVQQSIKNYICIAQEVMEDEQGISKKAKALDFAITQKLLPKIDGYYDNYKRLFDSLMQICDDNNLKMTKEALDYMQETANQNMGYCKYLV